MKILHVYKDYFPVVGGIENHVKMLAEGQAALAHEVAVLATSLDRHSHVEAINGVRVMFAERLATISSTPLSLEFVRLIAHERPDIVHLHFPYPWGEIANYGWGHGRRTVLTYHSDIVRQKYLRWAYAPLMQRVLGRVDMIIATSPNYVATSPVLRRRQEKCVVVPLGIDPSLYSRPLQDTGNSHQRVTESRSSPSSSTSSTLRKRQGEKLLLFVGHLRYYKGLDYLLRAMPELDDARLIVVGAGPMENAWKALVRELAIQGRVNFAGEVTAADLVACYAACDVFVLPCSERSEAFGMVQLEAMAAGKPVVSCDVGTGVAWVNQDEVTGLVVPPRDPAALANAIKRILRDPQLAAKLGSAGRERVFAEFTKERMVRRVLEVYEKAFDLYAN